MTKLTVSGYNFFSPQIFTAVKNAISHLKGHKIFFLEEEKKLSSWTEAKNMFKKIFKSLKIDKNNSQNLAKQKICKITLLYELEVCI